MYSHKWLKLVFLMMVFDRMGFVSRGVVGCRLDVLVGFSDALVLDISSETSLKIEIESNYLSYVIQAKMWLNYVRISLVSDDLTTTIGQSDVIRATHDFAVGFFLATLLSDKISFLFN